MKYFTRCHATLNRRKDLTYLDIQSALFDLVDASCDEAWQSTQRSAPRPPASPSENWKTLLVASQTTLWIKKNEKHLIVFKGLGVEHVSLVVKTPT